MVKTLFFVVLCSIYFSLSACDTGRTWKEEENILDKIVHSGNITALLNEEGPDAIDESVFDRVQAHTVEKIKIFFENWIKSSPNLQQLIQEVKQVGHLDSEHRFNIINTFIQEVWDKSKQQQAIKDELRKIAEDIHYYTVGQFRNKIGSTWMKMKDFFKKQEKMANHGVEKRDLTSAFSMTLYATGFIIAIFILPTFFS